MSESYWRDACAPIIAKVIAEHAGKPEGELRKALRDAYCFGERKYHPYKIWCDEVQRQLGKKPPLGTFGPKAKLAKRAAIDAGQGDLFTTEVPHA